MNDNQKNAQEGILKSFGSIPLDISMNSQAESFITELMGMQQSATITHRYQLDKKISTHLALGEFYDELDPLIDELVETYQGYFNTQLNVSSNGRLMIDPAKEIKGFCGYIDTNRHFCQSSFIQNQVDNIMALVTRTLYKLNLVQS